MVRGQTSDPALEEDLFKKGMDTAYRLLARCPRSRFEVEHRLRQRYYPNPLIEMIIEKLEKQGYLDDRVFARQWARDRMTHRYWGSLRLRDELQRKGVAKEWIEESLRELRGEQGEEERARELMARRTKRSGGSRKLDPRNRQRSFMYLRRRGYSVEVIQSVFRSIEKEGSLAAD